VTFTGRKLYLEAIGGLMKTSPALPAPRMFPMPKALCLTGLAIAAVLFLIFLVDLIPSPLSPFKGASKLMDIAFILCSLGLAWLSWTTWKEQV
jgi:hypothetical protein